MLRFNVLKAGVMIGMTLTVAAQSQMATPLAKDLLERFCRLDAAGKRLSPEGRTEVSDISLSPDSWPGDGKIVVIRGYEVLHKSAQKDNANFVVTYSAWGEIDSSLRFTRSEGTAVGSPVNVPEYINVILTDRHNELEHGHMVSVSGTKKWRVWALPSAPHIQIDTAIRYVAEMLRKSVDPTIRANAEKTIRILKALPARGPARDVSYSQSPTAVVDQFCRMDADGRHLGNDKHAIEVFFTQPGSRTGEAIVVIRDFVVSNAAIADNRATVVVEYTYSGELNSRTALFTRSMSGFKVRTNFDLVLTDESPRQTPARHPATWKINGPRPAPHITVDAAIRYITRLRDETADSEVKQNAEKALVELTALPKQ